MDALQQQTGQGDQVGKFHFNLCFRKFKNPNYFGPVFKETFQNFTEILIESPLMQPLSSGSCVTA